MKLGLIPKLLIGIVIGVLIGSYAPDAVIRLSETVRIFLGNLIKFIIPLIIVAFVSAAIAEFGEKAGRMLTWTVGISYVSTIIACVLGAVVAYAVIPLMAPEAASVAKAASIGKAYIQIDMPPVMAVMSALILAFLVGLGVTWTKSPSLRNVLNEGRDIVALIIKRLMIPLVPWFVGSIFVQLAAKGDLFATALIFGKMLLLIVVLQWIWLLIQYLSAGAYAKQNPFVVLKEMMPAYLTAMGTMSSAATMPVSLECARRVPFIRSKVADFVMPLCSTVHLSGAAMTITISAVTVSLITTGAVPPIGTMITFIILLGVIEVGAVGVPGGSVMAALGILASTLGFGEAALGLMLTLFMIQDSFGTATNIVGDGAVAMVINKLFGNEA
ncbi:MAG: dicarboxylate/amino acid:cation symporter [Bacillota bacterium]